MINRYSVHVCVSILMFVSFGVDSSPAGNPKQNGVSRTANPAANDHYAPFLNSGVMSYYGNNGDGSFNKFRNDSGFEVLKGDNKYCVYEDGVLWGGFHKGATYPKVGGSAYRHGLQAGKILTPGTPGSAPVADDPLASSYRVYRTRPDIFPSVDSDAVASMRAKLAIDEAPFISRFEPVTAADLYNRYVEDWNTWPAADGAPFTYGRDSLGIQRVPPMAYDPRYDIPGHPGADQTLWHVSNDMSAARVQNLAGVDPIGIEIQRCIWGYKRSGPLANAIFLSTLLINKSGAAIDSMFLVQWADPDLGNAGDDMVGCDTDLDLAFFYNGTASDQVYGTTCPAGGYVLLQGPNVPGNAGDTARFHGRMIPGRRNLHMTSFTFMTQGVPAFADPVQGTNGNVQWYNVMNGLTPSGAQLTNPVTGQPTKFAVNGDPTIGIGWCDGMGGISPGDRRFALVCGPFWMAPGDSQEIVVATVASFGTDRLNSLTTLRSTVHSLRTGFNYQEPTSVGGESSQLPDGYSLSQNYPNPFNPSTTIRFALPSRAHASLAVYDLLGQKVADLMSGEQEAGYHEVKFDGTHLASGVYIYRLSTEGFVQAKKLLLIR